MKTIFLDRDGVINENLDNDYVKKWDEFKFLPKAREAIKALTDANWSIIIITNQAGIGKGIMSAQTVEAINARMIDEMERCGGKVKAIYYCPHTQENHCECRKPKSGMLLHAANEFDIELSESYLIGDSITDIQAGTQVGCTTILVKTGHGDEYLKKLSQWSVNPDYTVSDLSEATELVLILNRDKAHAVQLLLQVEGRKGQ